MIQRIQTVYILLAAVFIALLLKLDFAELAVNGEFYTFSSKGIISGDKVLFSGLPVMLFIALIAIIHLVVIFMYKRRIRQIRILSFSIILVLGLIGVIFYFLYAAFDDAKIVFKIPLIFPLITVILDYLAIRAIGKDEALVRSLDRIR